ncbi:MAG: DNA (cytosine-5-)-methyltransferase, partial [Bacteroidota bacterium]
MKKDIRLLELFSGIGGFTQGLKQSGFNLIDHQYAEIEQHANAVYQYQYPSAIALGSVTTINTAQIERPNIITFGSPCQDFSYEGSRQGIKGTKSKLLRSAIETVDVLRPDLFIWENVKGAFSSNEGRDFQAILQAFTNIGGYRLEWQLCNTRWVLPQNRERIYLVGHLDGKSRPCVFPFQQGDQLTDTASNQERKKRKREQSEGVVSAITKSYFKAPNAGETYLY